MKTPSLTIPLAQEIASNYWCFLAETIYRNIVIRKSGVMKRIKIELYKILRRIGLERSHIKLFTIFNEELRFDEFDETCYLYYLESNFSISISEKDLPRLKTIENTIDYLHKKTTNFGGLN